MELRSARGGCPPLLGWLAILALAAPAGAHIELGSRTLQLLVADADLVARARILARDGLDSVPVSGMGRPTVRAELLELLKGRAELGVVRFAQHGHGVAEYEPGEEVLLFLRRIERSRELDALATAGLDYVSLQEHDEKYPAPAASSDLLRAAVRGYAEAARLEDAGERLESLRHLTVALLGSGDPRLAASALQSLVLAEGLALVTADDLPALEPLIDRPGLPIGQRLALLVELQRRGLLGDETRWTALLETTRGSDRRAVIRAAGRHPGPGVDAALLRLLKGDDPEAAREAAIALGRPGNSAAASALEEALARGDTALRNAAIRGLGRIATAEAQRVLEQAAASHPDPDTRRRARAEASLALRHGAGG